MDEERARKRKAIQLTDSIEVAIARADGRTGVRALRAAHEGRRVAVGSHTAQAVVVLIADLCRARRRARAKVGKKAET